MQVQSVRVVGYEDDCPYYAFNVYESLETRAGHWFWQLIKRGPEFQSNEHNHNAFDDIPIVSGVRHGSRAPDPNDKVACDEWLNSRS